MHLLHSRLSQPEHSYLIDASSPLLDALKSLQEAPNPLRGRSVSARGRSSDVIVDCYFQIWHFKFRFKYSHNKITLRQSLFLVK